MGCFVAAFPFMNNFIGAADTAVRDDASAQQEQEETLTVEDDTTDEFEDAGLPCEICNDEESVRDHFAVPCRHTACASCWRQWLQHSDKCMICGVVVVTTQRFNESVVPLSLKEKALRSPRAKGPRGGGAAQGGGEGEDMEFPALYVRNEELETSLNLVIGALVVTKAPSSPHKPSSQARALPSFPLVSSPALSQDTVTAVASRIEECKAPLALEPARSPNPNPDPNSRPTSRTCKT